MSPRGTTWAFAPDCGGKLIPESVKQDVTRRINDVAEQHFKGNYTRLDIRFKGQFCYIDAYNEPKVSKTWPPKNWPEPQQVSTFKINII